MEKPFSPRPPRVPFVRPLSLTPLEGDQSPMRLHATNLSRGGMFVRADRVLPPGTRVTLALEAGGILLHFAEGEVVWQHDEAPEPDDATGFGLRFTRLRPQSLALVEHLVARGGTAHIASAPQQPQKFSALAPARSPRRRSGKRPRAAVLAAAAASALLAGWVAWSEPPIETTPSPPAIAAPLAVAAPVAVAAPLAAIAPPPEAPVQPAALEVPPAPPKADLTLRESEIEIPTGAVRSVRIILTAQEVAVEPTLRKNAMIKRIFNLANPARLVIDVVGREPRYSWQLEGNAVVKSVRVGARDHGTRVVVDLPDPHSEPQNGYTLVATRGSSPPVKLARH